MTPGRASGRGAGGDGEQRLLVVVNRGAGTADEDSVTAAVEQLRTGADVTVAVTGDEEELSGALAVREDRRVVVVGGDGSVHAVVRALDRAGTLDPGDPVGIVPLGTGNDLARALGLPLDPVEAAGVVLDGAPRALDVLRDDTGGLTVNAVHAGVGARAYAEARRVKSRLGRIAYPVGAVLAGARATGWDLRVEVDGRVVTHDSGGWRADGRTRLLMAAVCNGPTIGGGAPLAPGAQVDDGLAEVVVCAATGPVARVAYAAAMVAGRHPRRRDVLVARGREVGFSGAAVELDADGELGGPVAFRTWRVRPGAWSVLCAR